jgi:hypothetical protein
MLGIPGAATIAEEKDLSVAADAGYPGIQHLPEGRAQGARVAAATATCSSSSLSNRFFETRSMIPLLPA